MKKKKLLITGGAGFIGSNIADTLQEKYDLIIVDNLSTGSLENLEGVKCSFRKGNCDDIFELVPEKVDFIFHLGIASSTTLYLDDKSLVATQILGSMKIFEKVVRDKAKIVIASSSSLYNQGIVPSKEDQEIKVTDFYTECRLAIERLAKLYSDLYGMKAVCLRMFSVYGGKREMSKKKFMNMITKFIIAIHDLDGELVSYGDGKQERDFIYIDDLVRAWVLAKDYNKRSFEIFNVGSGKKYNFNEILKIINKVLDYNETMSYEKNPLPNFVFKTCADTTKTKKLLNFQTKISLEEGIKKTNISVIASTL